jgi:hypothetical protein
MERDRDPNDPLERLAAKARQEEPPAICVDLSAIAPRFRPSPSPTRWLLFSAAVPAMAACLMVVLALQTSTASAGSTQTVTETDAPTADTASALFSPLEVELP